MKKIFLAVIVGFALTIVFYVVAGILSGGGHDLHAITAFFPYSLSLGILTEHTRWARSGASIAMTLLALQFPVYAIVLAISKRGRWMWTSLLILLSLHLLAVIIGLSIYHGSRSGYFHGAIQQALAADGAIASLSNSLTRSAWMLTRAAAEAQR